MKLEFTNTTSAIGGVARDEPWYVCRKVTRAQINITNEDVCLGGPMLCDGRGEANFTYWLYIYMYDIMYVN